MGAQNGLCQQITDLLSRGEHEDKRERGEEWKGTELYYHCLLQVCVLYGTPYISLITRNVVKHVSLTESNCSTFLFRAVVFAQVELDKLQTLINTRFSGCCSITMSVLLIHLKISLTYKNLTILTLKCANVAKLYWWIFQNISIC